MYKFVPRKIVVRNTPAKVVAIMSAHSQTTPFKPKARSSDSNRQVVQPFPREPVLAFHG